MMINLGKAYKVRINSSVNYSEQYKVPPLFLVIPAYCAYQDIYCTIFWVDETGKGRVRHGKQFYAYTIQPVNLVDDKILSLWWSDYCFDSSTIAEIREMRDGDVAKL